MSRVLSKAVLLLTIRISPATCPVLQVPFRNILWAGICEHAFLISLLAETKSRKPLELIHVTAAIAELEKSTASEFAEAVLCAAYAGGSSYSSSMSTQRNQPKGIPRHRRLKVFVNPRSGPVSIFWIYTRAHAQRYSGEIGSPIQEDYRAHI